MNGSLQAEDKKKILFLAASFFCVFGFSNVSYFLPVYYAHMGYSPEAAGVLVASFYLVSVILRPFLASVVALLGFRKMLLLAGVLSVISSVGVALADTNFWLALVSRCLLGIGSSLFQIGLATFQAIAFSPNIRGRAYSLIMAGGLLPMMTLFPCADWLLHRGHSFLYILLPVMVTLLGLIITQCIPGIGTTQLPEDRKPTSRNPLRGMADCFAIPTFCLALPAMFLFTLADATAAFMGNMTMSYGLMASLFLSSNALVGVCVRLFLGRILDRFPRWMLSGPTILIIAGMPLLASIHPSEYSLIACGLIFGVGMGLGYPLHIALVSDGIPPKFQAQAVSLAWFLQGLGFGIVPLIMGWMEKLVGPVLTLRLLCGLVLIGTCISMAFWHRHMRQVRE